MQNMLHRQKKKFWTLSFTFIFIIFISNPPFAQITQWKSFSTADGLGDVKVNVIFETEKEGNLWFGTRHGATRFDGLWKNFTQTNGLVQNEVLAIAEDDSGYLWFGTERGISRFKDDQFFQGPDTLASQTINSLIKDDNGRMWVATTNGAFYFNPDDYTTLKQHYAIDNGLISNDIRDIVVDQNENVWFGTAEHGVARLDTNGTWTYFTRNENTDGKLDNYIRDIFEDNQGNILFATWGEGVIQFNGLNWQAIDPTTIYKNVYAIEQDWDNNFWFATEKNVFHYVGKPPSEKYTTNEGLINEHVLDVLEDSYGNMWFATRIAGVSRYDGTWRSFLMDKGELWAIEKDNQGNLWFGFIDSGIVRYNKSNNTFDPINSILESKSVTNIYKSSDGTMWIGTIGGGATAISDTGYKTLKHPKIADNSVLTIFEDREQNLWFGTKFGGVSRYNPNDDSSETYDTNNSLLLSNKVHDIHQDINGNLWFATLKGISRYNDYTKQWENFTSDNYPFQSDIIWCIAEDGKRDLWFGTENGGVLYHPISNDLMWQTFTTKDGLVNNIVYSIRYDNFKDRLWFGTQKGISRFDNDRWYNFTRNETGMSSNWIKCIFLDTYIRTVANVVDTTINLWFGTIRGANRYVGESIPPKTVILSPSPDTTFGIASPFFNVSARDNVSLPEEISYSYKIMKINFSGIKEPWHNSWSEFSFDNLIVVKSPLSNGKYEVYVRARDSDKNIDQSPASLSFSIDIDPPTVAIVSPKDDQYISGDVAIIGIVRDTDLTDFEIEYSLQGTNVWESNPEILEPMLPEVLPDSVAVPETLAVWHTALLPDQPALYQLRLRAEDCLNHISTTEITAYVDQISKVVDIGNRGGFIQTTADEVELYIPPNALSKISKIHISTLDTLDMDYRKVKNKAIVGYRISLVDEHEKFIESPFTLLEGKQGVITIRHPDIKNRFGTERKLTIYHKADGTKITKLGGTPDFVHHKITAPFTSFGKFIVLDTLTSFSMTIVKKLTCDPRVFSTTSNDLLDHTNIIFTLKKEAPVSIYIYNVAGRLVRKIIPEHDFLEGENVIIWNGFNDNGELCRSGLYIVCAVFNGNKQLKTVAIVNR